MVRVNVVMHTIKRDASAGYCSSLREIIQEASSLVVGDSRGGSSAVTWSMGERDGAQHDWSASDRRETTGGVQQWSASVVSYPTCSAAMSGGACSPRAGGGVIRWAPS